MQIVYAIRRKCVGEGLVIYDQRVVHEFWRFQTGKSNFSVPINMPNTNENVEAIMSEIRQVGDNEK